jgi:hypothetical protein
MHFIVFSSVCGESADVCEENVAEWSEKLFALMDGYEPKDTANCDENGLSFQALPIKTLCLKAEKCSGGKLKTATNHIVVWIYDWGNRKPPLHWRFRETTMF